MTTRPSDRANAEALADCFESLKRETEAHAQECAAHEATKRELHRLKRVEPLGTVATGTTLDQLRVAEARATQAEKERDEVNDERRIVQSELAGMRERHGLPCEDRYLSAVRGRQEMRAGLKEARDRIVTVEAERDAAIQERDEAREELRIAQFDLAVALPEIREQFTTLLAERDTLALALAQREAVLQRYGQHSSPCIYARCVYQALGNPLSCPDREHDHAEGCRCGLAALSSPPSALGDAVRELMRTMEKIEAWAGDHADGAEDSHPLARECCNIEAMARKVLHEYPALAPWRGERK